MKYIQTWGKEVKKALIDKDMNITDLAKELGYSREIISNVINGIRLSDDLKQVICNHLNIQI